MELNPTYPYFPQIKTSPTLLKRRGTQYFNPISSQQARDDDLGMENLGYDATKKRYNRRRSFSSMSDHGSGCLEYPVHGFDGLYKVYDSEEGTIV